jgi:maltooligosyltrehalose synthase
LRPPRKCSGRSTRPTRFSGTDGRTAAAAQRDKEQFHEILAAQYYRLAFWKTANREINYRRFFNINELISIRVEDPKVLEHTHGLIFQLLRRAVVGGVRIDHIDGLNDPFTYLKHLRKRIGNDAYVVVEKILEPGEELPRRWPVQGTSGYDYLAHLNGVFCDPAHKDAFNDLYVRFTGQQTHFQDMLFEKKKLILERLLAGDLERLIFQFRKLSQFVPEGADLLAADLRQTLTVALCFFPVYRTYINSDKLRDQDRLYIEEALEKTAERLPNQGLAVQFLRKVLLLQFPRVLAASRKRSWVRTVMKFQQITGPLMAKGLEDTTFYIFSRLLSVNEVGGNPEAFGLTPTSSPVQQRTVAEVAPQDERLGYPRHQAGRTPAGPPERTVGNPAGVGGNGEPLARTQQRAQERHQRGATARQERGVFHLPDAARLVALRGPGARRLPGTHRRVPAQGHARSQGTHRLDCPERGI